MESRFDALAKLLSAELSKLSRRDALLRLGGGAAGAVLASLGLGCRPDDVVGPMVPTGAASGTRFSLGGGNSLCAHFCDNLPPGALRGVCKSEAAHGVGLCIECAGDFTRACPQPDGSYKCCSTDKVCNPVSGKCECPAGMKDCAEITELFITSLCCPNDSLCCGYDVGPGEEQIPTICCESNHCCANTHYAICCPPETGCSGDINGNLSCVPFSD
jgi:hypothetical protein